MQRYSCCEGMDTAIIGQKNMFFKLYFHNKIEAVYRFYFIGAPGRTRTCDLLLRKQAL